MPHLIFTLALIMPAEIRCQLKSVPDGCNTCFYELCTDGKKQWRQDPLTWACTTKPCGDTEPYNPEDWKEGKGAQRNPLP